LSCAQASFLVLIRNMQVLKRKGFKIFNFTHIKLSLSSKTPLLPPFHSTPPPKLTLSTKRWFIEESNISPIV